jgi:hypothetical protein
LRDVSLREVIVVVPLLALSLFLGLYPKAALDRIQPAVEVRVRNLERKSDYRQPEPPAIAREIQGAESEAESEGETEGETGTEDENPSEGEGGS